MLTYKLYLESLNSPYPYEKERDYFYFKSDNGKEYYVGFDDSSKNIKKLKGDDIYELWFKDEDEKMDITDSGDAFKILATVIEITKNFVKENKVNKLVIAADKDETNRGKLYKKLINKFKLSGWGMSRLNDNKYDLFVLINSNYKG